jgi:hypothetical protein
VSDDGTVLTGHAALTALGNEAKRLVADKEYMGMSVDCEFQYRTETICDESVHIIHTAYLEEISLVKAGAIEKAFAVRAKPDRPLSENFHTGSLASDGAYVQFMRAWFRSYTLVANKSYQARIKLKGAPVNRR